MRVPAIILATALFAGTAHASDVAGAGFGIVTCAGFSAAAQLGGQTEDTFFGWAEGYMTGWNTDRLTTGKDYRNLGSLNVKAQESFIRAYCSKYPDDVYMMAIMALMDAMQTMPPVTVSEGSR
jgi:hypothetical protein